VRERTERLEYLALISLDQQRMKMIQLNLAYAKNNSK